LALIPIFRASPSFFPLADDYYITEPHAISPSPTLASSEFFRSDLPSSVSSTTTTGCSGSTTFTYSRRVNIPTPSTSSEMVSSDTLTQHHYNVHQSHLPRRRHQPTSSFGSRSISPAPPMPTTQVFPATVEMTEEEGRTEGLMLSGMNGNGSTSLIPYEREAEVGDVPQSSETFRRELQKRVRLNPLLAATLREQISADLAISTMRLII
jgi:hypothetical protein